MEVRRSALWSSRCALPLIGNHLPSLNPTHSRTLSTPCKVSTTIGPNSNLTLSQSNTHLKPLPKYSNNYTKSPFFKKNYSQPNWKWPLGRNYIWNTKETLKIKKTKTNRKRKRKWMRKRKRMKVKRNMIVIVNVIYVLKMKFGTTTLTFHR